MSERRQIGCPANIEVLLWCYTRRAPLERADAPVHVECVQEFLDMGVIEKTDEPGVYKTTPLGVAWVMALERVPVPRKAFIDADGTILSPYGATP